MSLREQFEQWYEDQEHAVTVKRMPNGMYTCIGSQISWEAYQAGAKKTEKSILDLIRRLVKDQDDRSEQLRACKNGLVGVESISDVYDEVKTIIEMLEDIDMGVYKCESEYEEEKATEAIKKARGE